MKRAAVITGVSIVALVCAGPSGAVASPNGADFFWRGRGRIVVPDGRHERVPDRKTSKPTEKRKERREQRAESKLPTLPPGPLHVIISIARQHATLFAGGVAVAETKVSSGTPSHPTPMGVFTVIQKSRHHVSNLYDAPMPYMQRITWSGSALHEGPLPGRPASHGCVRLTTGFAQLLWKATKIGTRVIITRDEVAPVPIESDRLFAPTAKIAEAPAEPAAAEPPPAPIRTADATNTVPAVLPPARPLASTTAPPAVIEEPPAKLSIHHDGNPSGAPDPVVTFSRRITIPAAAVPTVPAANAAAAPAVAAAPEHAAPAPAARPAARTASGDKPGKPVSVFVSLKDRHLYVRQGWKPVFDAPIAIERPDRPIGTHVYTAMGPKPDGTGLKWTVVSIPSAVKSEAEEPPAKHGGRKPRHDHKLAEPAPLPVPSATAALDRLEIPPEVAERIGAMIVPGSSLIVSDNKLSSETGDTTDFIVLTP